MHCPRPVALGVEGEVVVAEHVVLLPQVRNLALLQRRPQRLQPVVEVNAASERRSYERPGYPCRNGVATRCVAHDGALTATENVTVIVTP